MRMKSRLSLFCACIIMAVAVQVAFAGADARQKSAPKAAAAKAQQKTPVLVQAYYPFNSQHKFIADYLKKYQKAHPKDVTVELYDQQTPEGRKAWMKTGLSCSGIFINGKTKWDIKRANGKTESVDFLKRMDVYWSHQDFETVVKRIAAESKTKAKAKAK
jgi:ABC-type glycerol-3-phosphate transport system substrate-binding protein